MEVNRLEFGGLTVDFLYDCINSGVRGSTYQYSTVQLSDNGGKDCCEMAIPSSRWTGDDTEKRTSLPKNVKHGALERVELLQSRKDLSLCL